MPHDILCTRTVIRVPNYDACYDFYKNVLRWPIFVEYANERSRGACFGDTVWGIEIVSDPTAPPDDRRSRGAMEVADVWALHAELAERLPHLAPLTEETWATSFMVTAPDGYQIKFFTRKPRS
ncbi:MAG: hypothetical protein NZ518_06230 [Dehalococcoidia bacterium]|nr:hypothetical protein [Dehalococcoidia bacterium]